MRRAADLTGQRFGRLVCLRPAERAGRKARWHVQCDCGVERSVDRYHMTRGYTRSCGCLARELSTSLARTHGGVGSAEYDVWANMRQRCSDPRCKSYARYGGRGIRVCDRWQAFENFVADMGPRPSPTHSIDRIDNNAGYSPENCRWATASEQARNRRTSRLITFRGETRTLMEWAERTGIRRATIWMRLHLGWPVDDALTVPAAPWKRSGKKAA